jgi:hypothetical protein
MKILTLILIVSLISNIFSAESCDLTTTKDKSISSFSDCQGYSTYSKDKICCYLKGVDNTKEAPVKFEGCTQFTGTEKAALDEFYKLDVEGTWKGRNQYLDFADCNFANKIALCEPEDRMSDTPLSAGICSQYKYVPYGSVNKFYDCCYITGTTVDKKKVYTCGGIWQKVDDKVINEIELGNYKRLGPLNDVKYECNSSAISISLISFLLALLYIFN